MKVSELFESLDSAYAYWAGQTPEAPAILSPDRAPLTFNRLHAEAKKIALQCREFGIGSHDAVATVMPQSVEQHLLIIGLSIHGVAAPLNPAYTQGEFEEHFKAFDARALFVEKGSESPAVDAAEALGLILVEVEPLLSEPAGISLQTVKNPANERVSPIDRSLVSPDENDIAMIVLTSGTTARGKPVPLTQKNICTSAAFTEELYTLGRADRCIRIMPLFHVFGAIHQGMIPLFSGGSVVSINDFNPADFPIVLKEFSPTWFGGGPTFHRAILDSLARVPKMAESENVRFVLSGGSPGPLSLCEEIESTFTAPFIEAYGLSEGTGLSTANPLGSGEQKLGSVGKLVGARFDQELRVVDEAGRSVAVHAQGEVVIRGPNVISGYLKMPEENQKLFYGDWLRTGDLGHLDVDGYLFIDGRLKEVINRGGEKISPASVDEVLMTHPDVEVAVTFPIPDDRLGEDVASAIVIREGRIPNKTNLRRYAAERLALFKVPHVIVFVDEETIPRNATGKPKRDQLAQQLKLESASIRRGEGPLKPPGTEVEKRLVSFLSSLLELDAVGVDEDFFDLGGDSFKATALTQWIDQEFKIQMRPIVLFEAASAASLARLIEANSPGQHDGLVVQFNPMGSGPAVFCIPGIFGDVIGFRKIANLLGSEVPFYGLERQGYYNEAPPRVNILRMARDYANEVLRVHPDGPYMLAGYSLGGVIAYEASRILCAKGRAPEWLVLMDTSYPGIFRERKRIWENRTSWFDWYGVREFLLKPLHDWWPRLRASLFEFLWQWAGRERFSFLSRKRLLSLHRRLGIRSLDDADKLAVHRYKCKTSTELPTILFRTQQNLHDYGDEKLGWGGMINGPLEITPVGGDHYSLQQSPAAETISEVLSQKLSEIRTRTHGRPD
ncbi:MAG: hypothetical protein CL917_05275, partial [Deltaproteobacteria bacterium]|nr:hypothetical protein [Deltaproteobacteria bacterium]